MRALPPAPRLHPWHPQQASPLPCAAALRTEARAYSSGIRHWPRSAGHPQCSIARGHSALVQADSAVGGELGSRELLVAQTLGIVVAAPLLRGIQRVLVLAGIALIHTIVILRVAHVPVDDLCTTQHRCKPRQRGWLNDADSAMVAVRAARATQLLAF